MVLQNVSKVSVNECYINSLTRLTVVIPSYERQEYLLRAILFWAGSPSKLIIVDGSEKPLPKQILKVVGNLANIRYIHKHGGVSQGLLWQHKILKHNM